MATQAEIRSLTQAYRTQQVQRAALVAALVAAYYSRQVDVDDPRSVERWLEIMLPRIMRQHDQIGRYAAAYATQIRRVELPEAPSLRFEPKPGANEEQVRKSLMVVGPGDYLNKARQIERLDVDDQQAQALLVEAKQVTARKVAAAVARHTQNGGRQTLVDASKDDRLALGYVRVTKAKPCFFCAMLASRGLVYGDDSFDESDARFTGDGKAKVHDECQCAMKPVYTRQDPLLEDTKQFTEKWQLWGAGGGDAALRFRRGYEHWLATGEVLDWDIVNDSEAYRQRSAA